MFNSASALRSAIDRSLEFQKTFDPAVGSILVGEVEKGGYYFLNIVIYNVNNIKSTINFEILNDKIINIVSNENDGKPIAVYFNTSGTDVNTIMLSHDNIKTVNVLVEYFKNLYISDLTDLNNTPDDSYLQKNWLKFSVDKTGTNGDVQINNIRVNEICIGSWHFRASSNNTVEIEMK